MPVKGSVVPMLILAISIGAALESAVADESGQGGDLSGVLKEIRTELSALRGEVAELRQAVTEIHKANVPAPSGAVPEQINVKEVLFSDSPSLGDKKAAVGIVEFSDYQCPFCKRFHEQTFPSLKERFIDTGKLRYVYRNYPLDFHQEAKPAALAALCAGRENAYWKMQEGLFTTQERLGQELYKQLADQLKLNTRLFSECLRDSTLENKLATDFAYGQSLGLSGTPSFFIGKVKGDRLVNAKLISGAQPFEVFESAITELKGKSNP